MVVARGASAGGTACECVRDRIGMGYEYGMSGGWRLYNEKTRGSNRPPSRYKRFLAASSC